VKASFIQTDSWLNMSDAVIATLAFLNIICTPTPTNIATQSHFSATGRHQPVELLPGKTPVGKILSQISGQYFFPAILRIVEFHQKIFQLQAKSHQKFPALCASLYFPTPSWTGH
jgi:hypothetical protein